MHEGTLRFYKTSMECEDKKRLLLAYYTTTRFYSQAMDQLQRIRPTADKTAYNDLLRLSEDARNECDAARNELEEHILKHGC